jgi:hypothetical protein
LFVPLTAIRRYLMIALKGEVMGRRSIPPLPRQSKKNRRAYLLLNTKNHLYPRIPAYAAKVNHRQCSQWLGRARITAYVANFQI